MLPGFWGFRNAISKCEAEIPTAAVAGGSQNAPEFCHRNLWLSDGPTGGRAADGFPGGIRLLVGENGMDLMDFI